MKIIVALMILMLLATSCAVPRSQKPDVYVINNYETHNWVKLDNGAIIKYDVYSPRTITDYEHEYYYIGQGCIYMVNNQPVKGACNAGWFFVKRLDVK